MISIIVFKIFLYIILFLLVLSSLVMILRVSITISYKSELKAYASIGIIRINLLKFLAKKEKKLKKLSLEEELSKQKKSVKTHKKKAKKKQVKEEIKIEKTKFDLWLIKDIVLILLKDFGRFLKLKVCKLKIIVGGNEAAFIAMEYGTINSAVSAIYAVISNVPTFSASQKNILINADFLKTSSEYDVKIKFSIFVFQVVYCTLKAGIMFIKGDKK